MSFIESITGQLVSKALDLSLQNHKVIANNIANVDTAGYRPLKMDFETTMGQLQNIAAQNGDIDSVKQALSQVSTESSATVDEMAVKVSMDQEMVKLAKNTVNYQALLGAKSKLGSLLTMAIRGGRS